MEWVRANNRLHKVYVYDVIKIIILLQSTRWNIVNSMKHKAQRTRFKDITNKGSRYDATFTQQWRFIADNRDFSPIEETVFAEEGICHRNVWNCCTGVDPLTRRVQADWSRGYRDSG